MVKVSAFSSPEQYIEWAEAHVIALRANGLRLAYQHFNEAIDPNSGYKDNWLKYVGDDEEARKLAWDKHIDWLNGRIEHIEKEILKYERDIRKAKMEMEAAK